MDEIKMERTIRETLNNCAEGLQAPERLKTRIDFALRSGEQQASVRRRPQWGKKLAAACLVAALAVTGAVAGSGVTGWFSATRWDKSWKDFAQTAQYAQEHVAGAQYVSSFTNGYEFVTGSESTTDKRDDGNHTLESFTGLLLTYQKDGATVTADINPVQEEAVYTSPYDTVRTIADIEVHYREMPCIFLPADGSVQPTAEELEQQENGEINISYGTQAREENTFYRVSWIRDGLAYSIGTYDPGTLTEDDFFQMAQEVIES